MASRKTKWLILGVVAGVFILGLWAAAFVVAASGLRGRTLGGGEFDEEVLIDGDIDSRVATVVVTGEIFSDPQGIASGASDENLLAQLEQAREDESVKAVVVELNTPGGEVVASDAIYREVRNLSRQKPVVALMEDVAASGGYYIAAGAREIVAHPSTITGSIGVIMILPNLEGTAEKLGLRTTVIKSGPLKDIGSPFRNLTAKERRVFTGIIQEAYEEFLAAVVAGRRMDEVRIRRLADGRIYTGAQAEKLGLVDHLGDRKTAKRRAEALAGIQDAELFRYVRVRGLAESLGLPGVQEDLAARVADELGIETRPGLKYLWLP